MAKQKKDKPKLKDFPFNYWVVIMFEFFERGAYYGMMSILSVYMVDILGFSKEGVGLIKSTIQPLLYFLPLMTGAVADRMGYRRTLMFAFAFLGLGYGLTSQMTEYSLVFVCLVIMGIGAGTFKPIISGTIAKLTTEKNSTLGFGIFYWSINLGAFLFPLILVPYLKTIDPTSILPFLADTPWSLVIIAAAVCTGAMLIPTIFFFKEPERDKADTEKAPLGKMISDVFKKMWMVFKDWRFILFIFIYSWFWILYFQMFDTVLWYLQQFVDASALDNFVSGIVGFEWTFAVEHVTVINALTIVLLQLIVSSIVARTKALPTMIVGIAIGTLGMAILAFSSSIWIFILGIFMFSVGEMTAHPKYISYLGIIAPPDRKATYMGFGFLYGAFSSFIGPLLGANLYVAMIDNPMIAFVKTKLADMGAAVAIPEGTPVKDVIEIGTNAGLEYNEILAQAQTSELWLLFSGIGILCIIGLLVYQKFILPGQKAEHNQ
ncbi:MAG: MFS transporter [Ectothiorhodospiraceae bacterium]|nr:MFS transporter [Ectothiorhodospiraceae bacterium]